MWFAVTGALACPRVRRPAAGASAEAAVSREAGVPGARRPGRAALETVEKVITA